MSKIGYGLIYGSMELIFENESDRNEMALSLYQEHVYQLWNRCINWYEDPILTNIEEDASMYVMTGNILLTDGEYNDYIYGLEVYYGESAPALTLGFANEADRNEMYLSLWEEKEYEFWMRHQHYAPSWSIFNIRDVADDFFHFTDKYVKA